MLVVELLPLLRLVLPLRPNSGVEQTGRKLELATARRTSTRTT
jgi:hypothetical protein